MTARTDARTHTLGRTSLDEGSSRRCHLYLTTHSIRIGPTPMQSGGIRTHNPNKRVPADPCLRPHCQKVLKGSWRSLMPLRLKPSFSFILSLIFYCNCFIFCSFRFLLISFYSLYFVSSSTFHPFVLHLFLCSILIFLGDTYIRIKNRETVISIIPFGRSKEDKGSLKKIWKKKSLENHFMKRFLTEIQCTSRWNSQF